MKIFITTMDEPLYTNDFIKHIIRKRKDNIIGLAVSKGDRLTISKNRSKLVYIISLLIIIGPKNFIKNSIIKVLFNIRKKLSKIFPFIRSTSIIDFAQSQGIKTYYTKSVNNKKFINILKEAKPDVIINQTQNFLKKKFLSIPTIGVINRHNALLPQNRGRLTPFWILYKGEKESGVSIHFVNEELDSGDIIVQEKFEIKDKDDFNSIVKKSYEIAPRAMLKAIDLLEKGNYKLIKNDNEKATYNTTPTIKEAIIFRIKMIKRKLH